MPLGVRPRLLAIGSATLLAVTLVSAPATADTPPFRDPGLPLARRVDDLLGRLTPDEKIAFLHQYQPAVPRLGIEPFKTGTEALHGVAWSTDRNNNGAVVTAKGTVFPQAVGLGATWDPQLIKRVGEAVGTEARGYNALNPGVWGLQLWAPVVNLLRDPRWGRNEEGYSEDPLLTGAISTAYGRGITGDDPDHLRAAPVLKHYLANNNEVRRDTTSSDLRPRVKHEYDEAAFRPAIAADAATGVMSSYNLVNGRPMTAHADIGEVVRGWTDRPLFNVTDAGAPNNLTGSQGYYATQAEADAAIVKAGLDSFTVDEVRPANTIAAIKEALSRGLLAQADVDEAVRHILTLRFRLGEFDPGGGRYGNITPAVIDTPAHRALAREAAADGMVLLKNARGALPLDAEKDTKVAVVGQLAETLYTDWYSGALPYKVTPVDGIRARLGAGGEVTSSEGVDRIALKEVSTGRYVTAPAGAGGALTLTGSSGSTSRFDAFDWGQGVLTLRSAANGRYVGRQGFDPTSTFANDQEQPNGWFVQQQFKLEDQGDGTVAIRYAGYETPNDWEGPNDYLTVRDDGTLILGSPTAAGAARFARETVRDGVAEAVAAAKEADVAVVTAGSMPFINGREDHDRTTMALAEGQSELIRAVRAANPRTVVVVENSYPTTLTWEQRNVPALLWTTHAGAETGNALADVLFGDVNPAGRLPQTWYRSEADLPDILDYDIIKSRRTYQYFAGDPLYAFGHGLSYSTFRYGTPRPDRATTGPDGTVTVTVPVTNAGTRAGDEVVQLYSRQKTSRDAQPLRRLRAFQRVSLKPGQTRQVTLRLRAADLAHWDVTRDRWVVEDAEHELMVGASSGDIRGRATLRVRGETIPPRDLSRATRAVSFDDHHGIRLADETRTHGDVLAAGPGDWAAYADAALGSGTRRITLRAANPGAAPVRVEVRLDTPDGSLAGTVNLSPTSGVYDYAEASAPLTGATGRRAVYLVFHGEARVAALTLGG